MKHEFSVLLSTEKMDSMATYSPSDLAQSDADDVIGTSVENSSDESDIVQDLDETGGPYSQQSTSQFYHKPVNDHYIEDAPSAFVLGERDVLDQIVHTTRAMQSAIEGHDSTLDPEDQSIEFKAAFESTPGGLEEVALATDRDLIQRKLKIPPQPTH